VISENAKGLIQELAVVAKKGPIKAVGNGPPSVGMTLLAELGITYSSQRKPQKNGIVVSARRGNRAHDPHRVNLFAKVPDWSISELKSSREILETYGYERGQERKLNCTVRAQQPNSQGLALQVDKATGRLVEYYCTGNERRPVVSWKLGVLQERLKESHPETIWVSAQHSVRHDSEFFHYRFATYSGVARVKVFSELISEGTITVDHIIGENGGRVTEKGPLFKIKPSNLPLLFPENALFNLMSI
jgi:hypothetical protein